jgi:hypothetical protein
MSTAYMSGEDELRAISLPVVKAMQALGYAISKYYCMHVLLNTSERHTCYEKNLHGGRHPRNEA